MLIGSEAYSQVSSDGVIILSFLVSNVDPISNHESSQ